MDVSWPFMEKMDCEEKFEISLDIPQNTKGNLVNDEFVFADSWYAIATLDNAVSTIIKPDIYFKFKKKNIYIIFIPTIKTKSGFQSANIFNDTEIL